MGEVPPTTEWTERRVLPRRQGDVTLVAEDGDAGDDAVLTAASTL